MSIAGLNGIHLPPGKTLHSFASDGVPMISKAQIMAITAGASWAICKLNKYDLLILDDFAHVTKGQTETSVLFELIPPQYEHRSILITANQPFWGVEQGVCRSCHDARSSRSARTSCRDLLDQRRELPPQSGARGKASAGPSA